MKSKRDNEKSNKLRYDKNSIFIFHTATQTQENLFLESNMKDKKDEENSLCKNIL